MDFLFTEEQEMLRDSVRKLMARFATPEYIHRLDREKAYPDALYDAWVEAGLLAIPFPEEYGGLGGSLIDVAIIGEELGRTSADFVMVYAGSLFCGLNVFRKGTEEQKRHWIPKVIAGEIKMTVGISEADAGSDVGAMKTAAHRDGNHWVISGRKMWQTGSAAKRNVMNVYVKTNTKVSYRQGMSLILVPNDTPGLEIRKLDMLGRYCAGTYEVTFDNVRVPLDNLIGGENKGWECILAGLQGERAIVAACDCGSAAAVVDMTIEYAKQRSQFGRPIGTFQAIAHMIADMQTKVEAAKALMWRAVWLASTGKDALREIMMAKLFASEIYVEVSNMAMQIFGGNGYSMEYDIQRHYRDSRIGTVAAGSSQMLRNLIAGLSGLKVQ
jgi:alkylation response protein AidB-like acyl-CoA dehydrogenase